MEPAGMIEPELLVATCRADESVLSRNEAWIRLLGDQEELWERLVEDDQEIARQNFREAAQGSLVTHALFMVERANRDIPVPVLLHFVPVRISAADESDPGASAGAAAVSISGEILAEPTSWTESQTERHRMETLGRMTMGMAHDFNNLLAGIMGHVELWRATVEDDDEAIEHINTIERAARDGADLIGRIQRYIRQERRSDYETVDLTSLVVDCISFTRPYWYNEPRRQGIAIEFKHEMGELPSIMGSPAEIRDVIVNLILNAVHALPDGGTICMRGQSDDENVIVRITDDGTGMSQSVMERIFEPLYSTKGERGTGMGLAVAAGVMREHDGHISVESELGTGTTFTLTFPLASNRVESPAPQADERTGSKRAKVLVVDDERMVLSVIERLLTLRDHTVITADSAAEALGIMDQTRIDIVFTDQGMPEMSGREFAHQLAKREVDIPVVLLTGDTDLEVNQREIARVLKKPFQAEDLQAAIADLV